MNEFLRSLRLWWIESWRAFWLAHGRCYCGRRIDDALYPFCSEECMVKYGKEMR